MDNISENERLLQISQQRRREYQKQLLHDMQYLPMYDPVLRSDEARKIEYDLKLYRGEIREPDKGFWGELGDEAALAWNRGWRSLYNTFGSQENVARLDEELRNNPQWLPPEERGFWGEFGGMIGSGLGSSAVTLPASIAGGLTGTAIGGPAGTIVGFALPFFASFAVSYGDVLDRNISNGMSDSAATSAAVLEAAAMASVETLLGTVPAIGKLFKGNRAMARAATQSVMGKLAAKMGIEGAKSLTRKIAQGIVKNGAEEGFEEALQYLIETAGESISETVGKGTDFTDNFSRNFDAGEMGHNALAGFVAGSVIGVPGEIKQNTFEYFDAKKRKEFRQAAREDRVKRVRNDKGETIGYKILESPVAVTSETSATPATPEVESATAVPGTAPAAISPAPMGNFTELSETEAAVVDEIDHMNHDRLLIEADRLGIPNAASMPEDILKNEVTSRKIADAKANNAGQLTAQDRVSVSTPVTAENPIDRQSLIPPETPITPPDTAAVPPAALPPAVPVNTPVTPAATVAPVPPAAPSAAPSAAPAVENPIAYQGTAALNATPEVQSTDIIDYNSSTWEPKNVNAYPDSKLTVGESSPDTIDTNAVDELPTFTYQPSQRLRNDINAVKAYNKELPLEMQITPMPTSDISDPEKRETLAAIQKIARALGVSKSLPVVPISADNRSESSFLGAHLPETRRNLINMSTANTPQQIFHTAMHELTHSLIEKDSKAYQKLLNSILPKIIDKSELSQRQKTYAANRGMNFKKLSADQKALIEEEFICDTIADLMQTENFWSTLSAEDMPLANKFLKALKDLLTRITAVLKGNISSTEKIFQDNLESVISLAQQFVVEASGKKDLNALFRGKYNQNITAAGIDTQVATQANTQVTTQVASAENAQTTDTATATSKENLSVAPAEESSVPIRTNPSTSVQAEQTTGEQDTDRKAADYEQRFGTVINTDNAKLLFKDDGYDPHDAESVKKFHPQASAIIRKLFDKFLKERKGKGNGLVVFTGGGNGSGKSSVMNDRAIKNADFVFDSAMVNYEAAKNSIQQVIDNGQTPLLAFVYRNPADAWFNGVQKRNQSSDGHIVPEGVFANTHAVAKETFLKLVRDFGDNVQYIIKEVADGKASEITLEELENKPKYTKDQIKEAIYAENDKRAKAILDRFSNQETDNQGYSSDGRSTGRGDRGVSEKSAEGVSGSVTSAESIISKITSAKAGSRNRIMAFTELPDGEHTVNGKTFTKSGNAFTLDGKTLNAKEIEKATRTTSEKMRKTAEETMSDAAVDYTPKSEAPPEQKPTISDKMRGKGKKETAVPSVKKSAPGKTDESGNTILFSKTGDGGNRRYYEIPFAKSVDAVINGKNLGNGLIFVTSTPEALQKIGIPMLPIMITQEHIKDIYNNYAPKGRNAHGLGEQLKALPQMLEKPVAVIASEKAGRVIVITQYQDPKGNDIMIPVIIGADTTAQGGLRITANIAASTYGKQSVQEMLKNAINEENNGNIAVFGANKKIASKLSLRGLQLSQWSGFDVIHNIDDVGSPVKGKFKKNIETLQFKKWFKDSKAVDENGEPLVVYHGSSADFTVFDHRFGYRNGAANGRGFYFTSDKSKAEGYKTNNGKLFEVYLRLQKPLNPDELTITKAEVEKIVRAIDTDGTYVADYAQNDIGYPGKMWHDKAVKSAVNAIYDSSDNNADIIAEIYSVFGQGDALAKITEATGYDGFVKDDVYVVFNPTQIKSATDNIGTFDGTNPDIRFSKPGDGFTDPESTQTEVEEKIDRESEKLTDPELTAEEREKRKEVIRTESSVILETLKHLFGWKILGIKKARSGYYTDNRSNDITLMGKLLRTPIWLAKKFKGTIVESIVNAALTLSHDKNNIFQYLGGETSRKIKKFRSKSKEMYRKLNEYLLTSDRDQTGAGSVKTNKDHTVFTAVTADGKILGKYNNLETAWEELFKAEAQQKLADGTLDKTAAELLLDIRRAMRKTLLHQQSCLLRELRNAGIIDADSTAAILKKDDFSPEYQKEVPDEINLLEMLTQMGERSGYYFPRKRIGTFHLIATKQGSPTIREAFINSATRAWRMNKLQKQGYTVRLERVGGMADMIHKADPMALSDVINEAFARSGKALKEQIKLETVNYTRKDGTSVKQLVIKSDLPFSRRMQSVIKNLGGRFYDGAWRFSDSSADARSKIESVIKEELAQDMTSNSILRRAIADSLVDMIRENGASSSKIARRNAKGDEVVRGYIEDLEDAFNLHVGSVSGSIARNVMARKMIAAWNGMDFDRQEFIESRIPEGLEKGSEEYKKALLDATSEYYKEVHRRSMNSMKQPELAKYMDKYIKDMLRNPSDFETLLGFAKGLAAVRYLASVRSAIGNLLGAIATVPAEISNETGENPVKVLGKLLKGFAIYGKYHQLGKYGIGSKLDPLNFKVMEIIHKNGWDGADLTADAAGAGKHAAHKWWNKISGGLLLLFSHVEQFNRAASIHASLQSLAETRKIDLSKLNDADLLRLLKEAKGISDLGNGVYNKANKLTWTRGSDMAAIADAGMLFQTYTVNYYNMMVDMFRRRHFGALLYMTAGAAAVGGMGANLVTSLLASAIGALGNPDDEEDDYEYFYNTMIRGIFGDTAAQVLRYGLPALAGFNFSGTFNDPIAQRWQNGFTDKDKQIDLTDFPILSTFQDAYDAISYHASGQHLKGIEKSPLSFAQFANVIRSFREADEGVTDRVGRRRKDIHDEYIKTSGWDSVVRFLGFNPVGVSDKTDRVWSEKKVKQKYADMRKGILTDYRDLINDGNPSSDDLMEIYKEIEEYNAKVRRSKRNIPFIDETTLKNALADTDNKFFVEDLDEKAQKRREKKSKQKIVIRNGKLVKE